ncbi:hypothetical protein [Fibrobacter sp. UWS1]|uniref:hypothetical protein n=1 Tax=Fibrobacter sp. UWS1 TaxID=1896220 RepID=UPI000BB163CF|nr:hypothetical protein [Fibrobacter sp. UWS1]
MIQTVGSICSGIEAASVAWKPFGVVFWLFINMCGWLRHPFFVDFRLNQTKKMGYFLKFNRQKKTEEKAHVKIIREFSPSMRLI